MREGKFNNHRHSKGFASGAGCVLFPFNVTELHDMEHIDLQSHCYRQIDAPTVSETLDIKTQDLFLELRSKRRTQVQRGQLTMCWIQKTLNSSSFKAVKSQ